MSLWYSLALTIYILVLLGSLIIVPLGFPGTWLMIIISFVYSLITDFQTGRNDFWVIGTAILLALLAEALEFGISIVASKKLSVSNGAVIASLVGGILGTIVGVPIPLLGSVAGLFCGTFLGAFVYEMIELKKIKAALLAALGAFFSRVTALFVKTTIAFVMVIYLLVKTF